MKKLSVKDKRYTSRLVLNDDVRILIPKPYIWGTFEKAHGCSLRNGVCIALQFLNVKQKDGTIWNPQEIYTWAKKNVRGYTGSKLTIYGATKVINNICHYQRATWHAITGKNDEVIIEKIGAALKDDCIVLFEQRDPIHTVAFVGFDEKNRLVIIDNGKAIKSSVRSQVKNKALHGKAKVREQTNWFKTATKAAGYVVVRKG